MNLIGKGVGMSSSIICRRCPIVIRWHDKYMNDPRMIKDELYCGTCADIVEDENKKKKGKKDDKSRNN